MVERAAAGLIERHGARRHRRRRRPDHPHPDARHAVLRRRWRDGASPWHETELGDRPAQRWLCGVRTGPEAGAHLLESGEGRTALIAVAQNAAGTVFDQPTIRRKAQAVGARRRRGSRAGHRVGRVADPRRRMPHLRRVCRRHDALHESAPQVVAGGSRRGLASASPKPRSPRCWRAATGRCPRCAYAVCDRIGVKPKDLDLLVTNQPNRALPAQLARGAGDCPRNDTATPSTSAATCSPPAFRSTWSGPSPTASSRRVTW